MATLGAGLKRPSSSGPAFHARNVRTKLESRNHENGYTEEEHNVLEKAARVLGMSVQCLKEQHKPSSSIAMTDDDASTSVNESFPQTDIDSFQLKMPRLTRRSHHPSDSESSNALSEPDAPRIDRGSKPAIIPWLSSCPLMEQDIGFSFPNNEEFLDQPLLDGLEVGVLQNPNIWSEIAYDNDWMLPNNTLSLPFPETTYGSNIPDPQNSASFLPLFECDASFIPRLTSSRSVDTGTPASMYESLGADSPHVKSECHFSENDGQRRHSTGNRAKRPRRSYQDPAVRLETSQTRRDKACVRCSMQRVRVSRLLDADAESNY